MANLSPSPAPAPAPAKRPQPLPWTHEETVNLIRAYQEKWYSQKRGPLKASQWEEVAVTVAVRCGYDHSTPSAKSAIQCRHKMEKLRKRYRGEKERGAGKRWQYFDLMDSLTRGPLPVSAAGPLDGNHGHRQSGYKNIQENFLYGDQDGDDHHEVNVSDGGGGFMNPQRFEYVLGLSAPAKQQKREVAEQRIAVAEEAKEKEEEEEEEEEEAAGMRLAAEIRGLAKKMVGMGKRKTEMMRESEKWRMEMENKRMKLIVDSHTKIVHLIESAFGNSQ